MSGYHPDAINEVLRSRSRNSRAQDIAGRGMSGNGGAGHRTLRGGGCPDGIRTELPRK